jgi:GNAT superfamily N-acetyltransferase
MIRRARKEDKSRVLIMAMDFHIASGMPFAFSAAHASLLFDACLSDPDRLCLVLDENGPQGVLAAQAGELPLAPVKAASELIWWIEPQSRGRSALAMLDAYEQWAKERGCIYANMVGLGFDPVTTRLYERRGYVAAESHFMKALTP